MIEVTGLSKTFLTGSGRQRKVVPAVRAVSWKAADGAITGLLGPNGAGKTTTLRMVAALLSPDSVMTLAAQGGPMTAAEVAQFEAQPGHEAMVELRIAESNRHALARSPLVRRSIDKVLKTLKAEIAAVDKALRKLVESDDDVRRRGLEVGHAIKHPALPGAVHAGRSHQALLETCVQARCRRIGQG